MNQEIEKEIKELQTSIEKQNKLKEECILKEIRKLNDDNKVIRITSETTKKNVEQVLR